VGSARQRENARVKRNGADRSAPQSSERQREKKGVRVGADRRDPHVRHQGHTRAKLGLMGQLGMNWLFYFPGNF
jgi:hypothetical protein